MRLTQARYGDTLSSTEVPTNRWAREEYFDQPDKDSSGTVVNWYYSPQLDNGELYVWQVANSIRNVLRFTYMVPSYVYTETTDVLEFPSEFYLPLKWAIAADIGPSYALPDNRQAILEGKAAATLEDALEHDVEYDSMYTQPDFG